MVLPSDNQTGLSEFDHFFSGMHTILIGELGQLKDLRVISKHSSKAFKDNGYSLEAIAREHKIKSFLEPTVYCFGDSICLQITLIRAIPREKVIWVENFKLAKDEILDFQHEITRVVARKVHIELSEQEQRRLSEVRQVDTVALDAYFRALNYLDKLSRNALDSAEVYFHTARVRDPEWALPYSGLAKVAGYKTQMGFTSPASSLPVTY
jgi:TolB-like protein